MKFFVKIVIALTAIGVFRLWQSWELKQFRVRSYEIPTPKLKKKVRLAVLADLHGYEYGGKNVRLIEAIVSLKPDIILIAGDLIVSKSEESFEIGLEILHRLVKIAPVYYSYGNHESWAEKKMGQSFRDYLHGVELLGVKVLRNEHVKIQANGQELDLAGLELDFAYYKKGKDTPMEAGLMKKLLGSANKELFQILLAHNPAYSEEYAAWGADVSFCGHDHGGLINLPFVGPPFSPQLTLFPKYYGGEYTIQGKKVLVSRGLGTHTYNVRINNRAELLVVDLVTESSF